MGEWELILFSSFSAAASSFRLPACVMLCVVLFFFCLPYAFVYRPVFGFVCFCVLHMRFFRSFGLLFPFACAALSQRRRQRRDSKRQQSQRQHNRSLPACLVSLSHTHTLFCGQEDATFHESVCQPAVLLNVN